MDTTRDGGSTWLWLLVGTHPGKESIGGRHRDESLPATICPPQGEECFADIVVEHHQQGALQEIAVSSKDTRRVAPLGICRCDLLHFDSRRLCECVRDT
jgi:hypothetical protein